MEFFYRQSTEGWCMAPISAAGAPAPAESLLGPATEQHGLEKPGTKTRWGTGGITQQHIKILEKVRQKQERQRTDVADVRMWQVDAVQRLNYLWLIAADILIRT